MVCASNESVLTAAGCLVDSNVGVPQKSSFCIRLQHPIGFVILKTPPWQAVKACANVR
jgi:hypothetical protein